MLAEPKRKTKYSCDPRGQRWSDDSDKFGQKLMEKMGWTKGKGLGAKLDGTTSHVKVSNKFDSRGVGCSKNYADNWVAHQDDFNELLASLNQGSDTAKETDEVQCLEKNGKLSKGRLHYQKFTKGKDLSGASAVDMDCIFGRRKSKSASNTPQCQSEASSDAESSVSEPETKAHGVITLTSNLSVQDYFAQKMLALKQNSSKGIDVSSEIKTSKRKLSNSENKDVDEPEELIELPPKKKKSKKKMKNNSTTIDQEEQFKRDESLENSSKKGKKKKKKKSKQKDDNLETCSNELVSKEADVLQGKCESVVVESLDECDQKLDIQSRNKKHKKSKKKKTKKESI